MTRVEIPPIPIGGTNQPIATVTDESGNHVQVMILKLAVTSTPSTVPTNVGSVPLLASNANRKSARIVNDSAEVLYIKEGTTATVDDWIYQLQPRTSQEIGPYSGVLHGIWAAADALGKARIVERT